jgi:glutamate N-acetyltransferase/amino-acid N-acetyltransferase
MSTAHGEAIHIQGFEFSAVWCGIKKAESLDLALIYSSKTASIAGAFTKNCVPAAPVVLDRQRLRLGRARAILANSGCANACAGSEGYKSALQTSSWVAEALGISEDEVFVASTGVIGVPLPMERVRSGLPRLVAGLKKEKLPQVAQAIMTTDTVPKWTIRSGEIGGIPFRIAAVAKGAGMIHPQMATMLCFVVTDASVPSRLLQNMLEEALADSFHAITVDGDTSTNDTVLVLANGASGAPPMKKDSRHAERFAATLAEVLKEMALALVRDAEGATKLIHLVIEGAPDGESARRVARAVAHSPLVKTAFFGEDVNWGRILAAVGYSGVQVEPNKIDLYYDQVQLVRLGCGLGKTAEQEAQEIAREGEFTVRISLGLGEGTAALHTCDLSRDYITINAAYRT